MSLPPFFAPAEAFLDSYCLPRRSFENSPPLSSAAASPSSPPHFRRDEHKVLQPLPDDSSDGYSSHLSIYEASPVSSDDESAVRASGKSPTTGQSVSSPKQKSQDGEEGGFAIRRNYSSFSGLSTLETITEQKSTASSRSVFSEREDQSRYEDSSDDEEYDSTYFYEYASPIQPIHPAMESSPSGTFAANVTDTRPVPIPLVGSLFSLASAAAFSAPPADLSAPPRRHGFRPPVSMYRSYGTLAAHPFHHAPFASLGHHRRSMDGAADEAPTPDELPSPTCSRPTSVGSSEGGGGAWAKLFRGLSLVCCCVPVENPDNPEYTRGW